MTIHSLHEKINELATTGGKLDKQRILEKYKNDEDFRYVLNFLLNPFKLTRISTKRLAKHIEPWLLELNGHDFKELKHLLAYLASKSSGTDYNTYVAQHFIAKQETDELKKFVSQLVTKDLKVGVSQKTVNKVYGSKGEDAIPDFAVMLAESFEKKHEKVTGKFYITLKLDGNRCVAIKENGVVKFFTRKGQPIDGVTELESELAHFPDNMVYDGELLLENPDNLPSDELFRATQKVVRKDGEKKNLDFFIFDSLPLSEFKVGKSSKNYEQRRNTIDLIFNEVKTKLSLLDEGLERVMLLPVLYEGTDKGVIPVMMAEVEANGYEGLMVNTAKGLYQTKRTNDLLKVKTMKTADLLVMSIEKAIDGQLEGLLGRVNVEYKGNLVGVGSGFSHEERKRFVDNPDDICGKIIEVQFFEESKDEKTGQPSLRFPVFKGIRHDKCVEDINYGE